MNELITSLTSQLGLEADKAEAASGAVIQMVQEKADPNDFSKLMGAVPEASGWMEKAASLAGAAAPSTGRGGLLGAATGMVGNVGAAAQGAAGLTAAAGMLGKLGIEGGLAVKLIPMVLSFLKGKAGDSLFGRLANAVPFINQAMSGGDASPGGAAGMLKGLFGK